MKKRIAFLLLLFVIADILLPVSVYAQTPNYEPETTFILPSSIQIVEDAAFEGTGVITVIIPEKLQYIGENAFAAALNLMAVFIPKATVYIGENAFRENQNLTIYGIQGSYADDWAEEHHIPFDRSDIWNLCVIVWVSVLAYAVLAGRRFEMVRIVKAIRPNRRKDDEGRDMRPQERAELHPIDYRFP